MTGDIGACYAGAQAFRHLKTTNVAYVDGHVGSPSVVFKGPHATDSLLSQMGFPKNGFLSDDESAYDPR
jgi:prepilin-type processing-associated H-X9-DG protein